MSNACCDFCMERLAEAWERGALWAAAECGVIEPDCPPELWLTPGDNPYREQETP